MNKTKPTIANGTKIYNIRGVEAILVSSFDGGYIVRPLIEQFFGDESEIVEGEETIWREEIFTKPPVQRVNEEVKRLDEKYKELSNKVISMHSEAHKKEAELKSRLERLAKYKGLENLEKFLTKGISHYVFKKKYSNDIVILPIEETKKSEDSYDYKIKDCFRMLTLYGNSNGDLEWGLSEYKAYDYNSVVVIPCVSYEEAKVEAEKLFKQCVEKCYKDEAYNGGNKVDRSNQLKELAAGAIKLGILVEQSLLDRLNKYEIDCQNARIESARKAVEKAQLELNNLLAGQKSNNNKTPIKKQ